MYIYHGINLNLKLPIVKTLFFFIEYLSIELNIDFWELLKLGCEGNMFSLIDSRSWLCFAVKSPHRRVVFYRQNLATIAKTPS